MLRVGSVPYLVGRPLDLGLGDEPDIELSHAVPARLVAGLRDGSLDVALVSSIELFRRPGYAFLDGIGVSGASYVSSVQVFLRKPLAEVRSVALDPSSRTAAALTQVTWPRDGQRPAFLEVAPGSDPRQVPADAWLRIGDPALVESLEWVDAERTRVFNPSQAWAAQSGLPFIFAPWIVAPGVDIEPHLISFAMAHARGLAARAELAAQHAQKSALSAEQLTHYLVQECHYAPGAAMQPSLLAYRDAAAKLELARGELTPRAIELPLLIPPDACEVLA